MNSNELPLVSFGQAKKLKEGGFDWLVSPWYDSDGNIRTISNLVYAAPTVALALKWFRDEKNMKSAVGIHIDGGWCREIENHDGYFYGSDISYDTCEAAESENLDDLLILLELEKK